MNNLNANIKGAEGVMRRIIGLTLLLWSFAGLAFAQQVGTNTAQFLKLAPNARAAGMGYAFTGLADDVHAMYWNPGGLGLIKRFELGISGQQLYGDLLHLGIMGTMSRPFLGSDRFTYGLGLLYLGATDDIQSTEPGTPFFEPAISSGDLSNFALIVPFGYRLDMLSPNWSVGLSYKYINSKLSELSASGHGVDLGVLGRFALRNDFILSVGATVQNLTLSGMRFSSDSLGVREDLPGVWRLGAALGMPVSSTGVLTFAYDAVKPFDNVLQHNFGAEYLWNFSSRNRFFVRSGYRLNEDNLGDVSFSVGYGFSMSQFDYAYNNYSPGVLSQAHLGTYYLSSSTLEPFYRLRPEMGALIKGIRGQRIDLSWERALDLSPRSRDNYYLVVLDTDPQKVSKLSEAGSVRSILEPEVKRGVPGARLLGRELGVVHAAVIHGSTRSTFVDTFSITETFYWAVSAMNPRGEVKLSGEGRMGHFIVEKAPDFMPLTLELEPYDRLDLSPHQGIVRGAVQVSGHGAQPFRVRVNDVTAGTTLGEVTIKPDPHSSDKREHEFELPWQIDRIDSSYGTRFHTLRVEIDPDGELPETNKENNHRDFRFLPIPKGQVVAMPPDEIEFHRYESIELPTLVYVFFDSNSVAFSHNSTRVADELHPDSLLQEIARRLVAEHPLLPLSIYGYYHPGSDRDPRLAIRRAEVVRDRLIAYGVPADQIKVVTRPTAFYQPDSLMAHSKLARVLRAGQRQELPQPLRSDLARVAEENRRVEIRVSRPGESPNITSVAEWRQYEKQLFSPRPIPLDSTARIAHNVPFRSRVQTKRPLASIRLEIYNNAGDPFPIHADYRWETPRFDQLLFGWDCRRSYDGSDSLVAFNRDYAFRVVATDTAGFSYTSGFDFFALRKTVNVVERKIFSLAKFDNVTQLHEFYQEYLADLGRRMRREDNFRVKMTGHTDIIGIEAYNDSLSVERAFEVALLMRKTIRDLTKMQRPEERERLLVRISPDSLDKSTDKARSFGRGPAEPLVAGGHLFGDNDRPQGRLLNRRVEIELIDIARPGEIVELPIAGVVVFPADSLRSGYRNRITSVAVADSITWLGTDSVVVRWHHGDNSFAWELPPELQRMHVQKLLFDPAANALWVGSNSGLFMRDDSAAWHLFDAAQHGLFGSSINDLLMVDGSVHVATNEGIFGFDGERFRRIGHARTGLRDNFVHRLYRDSDDQLWACTRQGVHRQTGERWEPFSPADAVGQDGLAWDDVRDMVHLSNGALLFATPRGVRQFHDNAWTNYTTAHDLPSNNVQALRLTADGTLWAATDAGLATLAPDRTKWRAFRSAEGLPNNQVVALVPAGDRLYVCTAGGLMVLNIE